MSKVKLIGVVLIAVILSAVALTACSGSGASAKIKAPWVKASVSGDNVNLAQSEVEKNKIVQFKYDTGRGNISFMAYELDKQLQVRADICVPCRSEDYSLKGDTLVCNTCGTVFSARTGAGISGACVNYPKASVAYEVVNGNLVMKGSDLVNAYTDTIKPG